MAPVDMHAADNTARSDVLSRDMAPPTANRQGVLDRIEQLLCDIDALLAEMETTQRSIAAHLAAADTGIARTLTAG